MKKLIKLITTITASIACIGFFTATAIVGNNDNSNIVETKAYSDNDYFYFAVATNWSNDGTVSLNDFKKFGVHLEGGSRYNSKDWFGNWEYTSITNVLADNDGAIVFMDNGIPILRCKNYGASKMKFKADFSTATYANVTEDITVTGNYDPSDKNMLIVNSHNAGATAGSQHAFWVHYGGCSDSGVPNTWNDSNNTSTLYFVPNYSWSSAYRAYTYSWPYLVMTYSSGGKSLTYSTPAHGVMEPTFDPSSRSKENAATKQYGFYFKNVPLVTPTSMYIYHNDYTGKSDTWSRAITPTDWYNSGLNYNFYTNNDTSATTDTSLYLKGFYYNDIHPIVKGLTLKDTSASKFMLRGSFANDNDISFTLTSGTSPVTSYAYGDFLADTASTMVYDSSSGYYNKSLLIDKNDSFQYYNYDYIKNITTSGDASSWEYNTFDNYGALNNTIQVIDQTIGNTPIMVTSGGVLTTNEYIDRSNTTFDGRYSIVFKKAGNVDLRISIDNSSNITLTIVYKTSGRPIPEKTADEPNYVIGTISDVALPLEFNYSTGNYEAIILSLATSEKFQLGYGASPASVTGIDTEEGDYTGYSGLIETELDAEDDPTGFVIIVGGIGYYRVGWAPANSAGSQVASYFVSKITDDIDEDEIGESKAVEAYGHRLAVLETCNAGDLAGDLEKLYENLTDEDKDDILETIEFQDYSFTDYRYEYAGNYESMSRTVTYNALYKHQYIQWLFNGGPVPNALSLGNVDIHNADSYKEANTIIVIIVAATSLVAIASLAAVNLLAIKKRKHK